MSSSLDLFNDVLRRMLQRRGPGRPPNVERALRRMTAGQKIPRCLRCESRTHWTKDCPAPR